MLSKKMEKALNEQVNAEMFSAYLYLSMSAYFESKSLSGLSSWMKMQAQEEMSHAMKIYGYINDRGGRVSLKAIAEPQKEWDSVLDVFEATLAHEQKVTGLINDLVNLALKEKDHATNIFLQWFVSEQVEEEDTAGGIVEKLKLIGGDASSLFILDQELGQRVFTPPAQ